eukprot:TRINITY_DN9958_c0_g2_i1.p1 TRINITY_DN9958_c0_g2~~TRINITY_DN9958_c0_g2_i1.p1  ORF type:complete len:369 (-),score=23.75 TRINITY_DN9958_c0_g2_i1:437-1543(-)
MVCRQQTSRHQSLCCLIDAWCIILVFFFFSSRRRHTRSCLVSWARRCVQETDIKEVDQFIQRDEFEFLQKVTEDFQKKLMKIENVGSVTLPYCEDKPSINVYVNSQFNTDTLIPKKFPYADLNGKLKQIDVVIIKDFEPVLHATILNPGDRIMNQVPYPKNAGSLGGRVFHNATNDALFLTCYHVVKSPNQLWNNFNPKCAPNVVDNNVNIASCGRIVFALRDMYLDVAVVQPAPDVVISDLVNGIGIPIHTRQLNGNDRFYHTRVKMFGMMSGLKEGIIYDFGKSVELPYQADPVTPSHKHTLYNVIVIQGKNGQFFSQGGDSGSFIIDDHNYLIGILVGGYGNLSFAMPIETILTETNTKIIQEDL